MEPSSSQHFKLRSSKRNSKRTPEDDGERESQSKKLRIERKGKGKEQVVDAEISQRSSTHSSSESSSFSNHEVQPCEDETTALPAIAEPPSLVGSTFTLVVDGAKRVLRVIQVIFRSDGLIGRGTNVLGVECIEEEVVETSQRTTVTPEQPRKGCPLILKISFPPSERTKESELIHTARAHAKAHDAEWALQHLPLVIASADSLD